MNTKRHTWKVLGAGLLMAVAVSACSSSSPPAPASTSGGATTPTATSPAATPSSTTTSGSTAGATAAITTNWETFFNSKTSVAKRVSLLQDGSQFTAIITAQQHNPLAAGLTAKVVSVSSVTASTASVKYNLIVAGSKVPQTGNAVNEGGTWKVGVATFCALLNLEGLKSMPASCNSAG